MENTQLLSEYKNLLILAIELCEIIQELFRFDVQYSFKQSLELLLVSYEHLIQNSFHA